MKKSTKKLTENYEDSFFNIKELKKKLKQTRISTIINKLSNEVFEVTKGKAKLQTKSLTTDEATYYFNKERFDENYSLSICYTNKYKNRITNTFCVISYSEVCPVLILSLKNEDGVKLFKKENQFKKYLKRICNEPCVLSSLRLSLQK